MRPRKLQRKDIFFSSGMSGKVQGKPLWSFKPRKGPRGPLLILGILLAKALRSSKRPICKNVVSFRIFAEGLDNKVDEKDIAAWVSGNGTILNIEVRRFAPNKPLS